MVCKKAQNQLFLFCSLVVLNKECFQAEIINKVEYIMLGNELTDNAQA
jgi:hypothetical protein